ncbi:MAG: hypothetical protein ABIQ16_07575 [Polyangiaceae bacterium]
MSQAYTGGCACGAIRYEITGKEQAKLEGHAQDPLSQRHLADYATGQMSRRCCSVTS